MKYAPLFFVLLLISCINEKQEVIFVDYKEALDSIAFLYSKPYRGENSVDLCALFNKNDWDSIAFILPYLPMKEFDKMNFCNARAVRDSMKYVVGVEWNYGLLFFKNSCITSYSIVGGNPSFTRISGHSGPAIPILKRLDCKKIKLINVPDENDEQSFFFLPLYPTQEDAVLFEKYKEYLEPQDSTLR